MVFLAAEVIFALPFHLPRFFRYELLNHFGLTNSNLSVAQSYYGVAALLCYFPGGIFADRLSARFLMALSLALTGAGGLFLLSSLSPFQFSLLYIFWGLTTVLLFWSALIAFIRNNTRADKQGMAFGSLEFFRALIAAFLVTFIHVVIYQFFGGITETEVSSKFAMDFIIKFYLFVCFVSALACWFCLPKKQEFKKIKLETDSSRIKAVLKNPSVWCNLFIIISAYCAFKGVDYYALSIKESFSWKEKNVHLFITFLTWMRPFAALSLGFLGDKVRPSYACIFCFLLMTFSSFLIFLLPVVYLTKTVFISIVSLQLFAVFGMRGIYFSLFEESKVEKEITGTATGFICFLGFAPEIFLPLVSIQILDKNPGVQGFKNFFLFLALVSLVGVIASRRLNLLAKKSSV